MNTIAHVKKFQNDSISFPATLDVRKYIIFLILTKFYRGEMKCNLEITHLGYPYSQ